MANEDLCRKCSEYVANEHKALECEICKEWEHIECSGVPEVVYDAVNDGKCKGMKWECDACENSDAGKHTDITNALEKLADTNKILGEENKKLRAENRDLLCRVERVESNINDVNVSFMDKIDRHMTDIKKGIVEDLKDMMKNELVSKSDITNLKEEMKDTAREEVREELEKERKKDNIIVFNLPESEGDSTEEQQSTDTAKCLEILSEHIKVENVEIADAFRLGNVNVNEMQRPGRHTANGNVRPKPRPILIKVSSTKKKWEILKKAKILKQSTNEVYKNVKLTPDLTQKQREKDRQLQEELQEKIRSGERGWYISRGKLVRVQNVNPAFL